MRTGAEVQGSPGCLAAGCRRREVGSPAAHCARRLAPVPVRSAVFVVAGPV